MSDFDVVVVGGGVAGLRAARDLAEAGREVLVVEARDRLGGRTDYRLFPGTSRKVEMGGAWVSSRFHHRVMTEVRRYGLELAVEHDPDWRWALDSAEFVPDFPITGDELYDLERVLADMVVAARKIDTTVPRDVQGGLHDLDVSVAAWIRSRGLPARVEQFLFMMAAIGMGAHEEEWSALDAFSLMAGMQCSPLGWIAAAGEKVLGGTSRLVAALAGTPGVHVRLNTPVNAVHQTGDGVRIDTADGTLRARHLVLATPVNTWADIDVQPGLSRVKAELAARRHPGRMIKIWMLVDEAPPELFAMGRVSDLLCVSTQYQEPEGVLLVGFAAPPSEFDPADRGAVESALAQVLPEAKLIDHAWHDWRADPYSRGTWMGYPPGFLASSASAIAAPEGRIAFAGADLATTWIGWMEGALETGAAAAAYVLNGAPA